MVGTKDASKRRLFFISRAQAYLKMVLNSLYTLFYRI